MDRRIISDILPVKIRIKRPEVATFEHSNRRTFDLRISKYNNLRRRRNKEKGISNLDGVHHVTTLARATVSRFGHGNVASRGNVTHVAALACLDLN